MICCLSGFSLLYPNSLHCTPPPPPPPPHSCQHCHGCLFAGPHSPRILGGGSMGGSVPANCAHTLDHVLIPSSKVALKR